MKNNLEYIQLFWEHKSNEYPVVILYEVDLNDDRLVRRSIDIFADRTCKNIADFYEDVIEITSIPTIEEFQAHIWGEELEACLIEPKEFERIWNTHHYTGKLKSGTS